MDGTFVATLVKAIKKYRPGAIRLYPGQLAALLRSPLISDLIQEDLCNLAVITPVAATLPRSIVENVRKNFPSAVISNCYGTSEVGLLTRGISHDHLGWVLEGCTIKVCGKIE